jgi:biopolymer transport protein ExbD
MINIVAQRKNRRQGAELNMAPLIDMIFILLIFFLVTTSFVKETGVEIDRPAAATAVSQDDIGLLVAITADNRVFIDQREIDIRTVRSNVERELNDNPVAAVVVVADRNSSSGVAVQVMDGCRQAGAHNVALAAGVSE